VGFGEGVKVASRDLEQPCFWAENGGGFVWGDLGSHRFWAKIKGGGGKKDEKLKEKTKKRTKS